jgi:GntR family transcriptional regulator of arabinose operon
MSSPTTDQSRNTTKYGRLRNFITEQIASGSYHEGDFLPSEPELAKQFAISRGTVRQAISELESDGLVKRIPGKGSLVIHAIRHEPTIAADLRTGHYPALVQNFEEAASESHHQTIFCATGNDVRRQGDIILQLIDKNVAGVALSPPTVGAPPTHQIRQLQLNGIPVVLLHRGVEGISAPVISMPYELIARSAAKALLEKGHRRIAFVASHNSESTRRYLDSFASTIEEYGGTLDPELVSHGAGPLRDTGAPNAERFAEVEAVFDRMLSLPPSRRPTAAFDPWDADAEAIYLALLQKGKRIPADFSIVSFGGASRSGTLSSRISSVTINEQSIALKAVGLLEDMVNQKLEINAHHEFEIGVAFDPGETIAAAN